MVGGISLIWAIPTEDLTMARGAAAPLDKFEWASSVIPYTRFNTQGAA